MRLILSHKGSKMRRKQLRIENFDAATVVDELNVFLELNNSRLISFE